MPRFLFSLPSVLGSRIAVLGLMLLISLSGLFIFGQYPSYAATSSSISQEEKIDRAYQFRTGTGILEEVRQESPNRDQVFDPSDKHKVQDVKASKEENPEPSLVEQAQKAIKKVTGQK